MLTDSNYNKLVRRKSFIVLQMEQIEQIEQMEQMKQMEQVYFKKKQIENAIQIINKEQTFFNNILVMYYVFCKCILSYVYIKNIYAKVYTVKKIYIVSEKEKVIIEHPLTIKITDCGIHVHTFFIPYEYIIRYNNKWNDDVIYMEVFASIVKNDDNTIQLETKKEVLKLYMKFDNNIPSIVKNIKKNMYYHIKYNKIDESVIDYFDKNK